MSCKFHRPSPLLDTNVYLTQNADYFFAFLELKNKINEKISHLQNSLRLLFLRSLKAVAIIFKTSYKVEKSNTYRLA
jgi:hypothetical protein